MRILPYLLGVSIFMLGMDVIFTASTGSLYACPRCRRALPKGPRKLPHPGFEKKYPHQPSSSASMHKNAPRSGVGERLNEKN